VCAEIGLTYEDFLNTTWVEYQYLRTGLERRVERQWDYSRHMMATMFNASGFSKKRVNAKDIMKLPRLDGVTLTKPLRNLSKERINKMLEAAELLNS